MADFKQPTRDAQQFFEGNLGILGFNTPKEALFQTVKELTDNACDALKSASSMGCINVSIVEKTYSENLPEGHRPYTVCVQDTGTGMSAADVPLLLGQFYASTKDGESNESIGQFGVGVKAALLYSIQNQPITSGKLVVTTSRADSNEVSTIEVSMKDNIPVVLSSSFQVKHFPFSGTRVAVEILGDMHACKPLLYEYYQALGIVSKHTIIFEGSCEVPFTWKIGSVEQGEENKLSSMIQVRSTFAEQAIKSSGTVDMSLTATSVSESKDPTTKEQIYDAEVVCVGLVTDADNKELTVANSCIPSINSKNVITIRLFRFVNDVPLLNTDTSCDLIKAFGKYCAKTLEKLGFKFTKKQRRADRGDCIIATEFEAYLDPPRSYSAAVVKELQIFARVSSGSIKFKNLTKKSLLLTDAQSKAICEHISTSLLTLKHKRPELYTSRDETLLHITRTLHFPTMARCIQTICENSNNPRFVQEMLTVIDVSQVEQVAHRVETLLLNLHEVSPSVREQVDIDTQMMVVTSMADEEAEAVTVGLDC